MPFIVTMRWLLGFSIVTIENIFELYTFPFKFILQLCKQSNCISVFCTSCLFINVRINFPNCGWVVQNACCFPIALQSQQGFGVGLKRLLLTSHNLSRLHLLADSQWLSAISRRFEAPSSSRRLKIMSTRNGTERSISRCLPRGAWHKTCTTRLWFIYKRWHNILFVVHLQLNQNQFQLSWSMHQFFTLFVSLPEKR
jgi:hypothetical protein